MTDLHLHSVFSDGTCTPEEVVALAAEKQLTAAVLTDHDTVGGTERFCAAAKNAGIRTMSGMELSADVPGHTVHLLAYGFDPQNAAIQEAMTALQNGRITRNAEILSRLSRAGYRITATELEEESGGLGVAARPHIAAILVRKGYARDFYDAFQKFLIRGALAYVERYRLTPEDCISRVNAAGGTVVLAHPQQTRYDARELAEFVARLSGFGLGGIELHYPGHTPSFRRELQELCEKHGLFCTGGSDFHGTRKPGLFLGTGYGSLAVPDECYQALCRHLNQPEPYDIP